MEDILAGKGNWWLFQQLNEPIKQNKVEKNTKREHRTQLNNDVNKIESIVFGVGDESLTKLEKISKHLEKIIRHQNIGLWVEGGDR